MTNVTLEIKGEIEVLRLQPGDRLIVTLDRHAPQDSLERLREQLKEQFPDHESVIVGPGLRFTREPA